MSAEHARRLRSALALAALAALAASLAPALTRLHAFGAYPHAYGPLAMAAALTERHALNAVTTVTLDIRGIDTLGEEFILVAAVCGVGLLLRAEGEPRRSAPLPRDRSEAVRWFGQVYPATALVAGGWLALNGHLTPGGGFQGGVIMGASWIVTLIAEGSPAVSGEPGLLRLEAAEGGGAAAFALAAALPLAFGLPALANALPLGVAGDLLSGGTLPLLNLAVGAAVGGGLALTVREFARDLGRLPPQARAADVGAPAAPPAGDAP